jgi:hypothetical protein
MCIQILYTFIRDCLLCTDDSYTTITVGIPNTTTKTTATFKSAQPAST